VTVPLFEGRRLYAPRARTRAYGSRVHIRTPLHDGKVSKVSAYICLYRRVPSPLLFPSSVRFLSFFVFSVSPAELLSAIFVCLSDGDERRLFFGEANLFCECGMFDRSSSLSPSEMSLVECLARISLGFLETRQYRLDSTRGLTAPIFCRCCNDEKQLAEQRQSNASAMYTSVHFVSDSTLSSMIR